MTRPHRRPTWLSSLNPALRPLISSLNLRSDPPYPHFIGLGTQKGGTTSLYWYLRQHAQVHLPEPKELHYFSLHGDRGDRWYGQCFRHARPGQVRGEITPYYLFHPHAAERIHALLPQARLIVLLRDPVERTLSQYFHARRLGFENLSLAEALAREDDRLEGRSTALGTPGAVDTNHQRHSYLSRSRYEEQLPRYQQLFDPEQLLIMRSEDLRDQPEQSLERVTRFLGLPSLQDIQPVAHANKGKGEAEKVDQMQREELRQKLESTYRWCAAKPGLAWD